MFFVLISVFFFATIPAHAGYAEGFQAFLEGDYETTYKEYKLEADNGNAFAQADLGDMYYHGVGIGQNYSKARQYFIKAAEQSHSRAQYNLGVMYENGYGVEQDYEQAIDWWCKASEQGHWGAAYNIGMLYYKGVGVPKDREEAARRFNKVAIQGVPGAQYHLGIMYLNADGVGKSFTKARYWLKKAYDNMDPDIAQQAKQALDGLKVEEKIQLF